MTEWKQQQYELGKALAQTALVIAVCCVFLTWIPMLFGWIPFSGLLFFVPILPLAGALPGLHAMALNSQK